MIVFGGGTTDAEAANLGATLKQPPKVVKPQETDLVQALSSASSILGQGKLEGIVLLTDGRNSTDDQNAAPTRLTGRPGGSDLSRADRIGT